MTDDMYGHATAAGDVIQITTDLAHGVPAWSAGLLAIVTEDKHWGVVAMVMTPTERYAIRLKKEEYCRIGKAAWP